MGKNVFELNKGEKKMHLCIYIYMDKEAVVSWFNEFASPNALKAYSSSCLSASPYS